MTPSGRSDGGFRLFTEPDVQRLLLVRALKPAEFSLGELQEILALRARLAATDVDALPRRAARLGQLVDQAAQRLLLHRDRLIAAELAVEVLRGMTDRGPAPAAAPAQGAE